MNKDGSRPNLIPAIKHTFQSLTARTLPDDIATKINDELPEEVYSPYNDESLSLDTADREIIVHRIVRMTMPEFSEWGFPCFGDSDDYKERFLKKLTDVFGKGTSHGND